MTKTAKTYTLYAAAQKVWGSSFPRFVYFESIKERNAFVKSNDYTDIAGTVKLTPSQYEHWKTYGEYDPYA